jgi:signal transduction histidine kinase
MKRLASLRSRLLVLVLVAVLPAFALTLYTHLEHRGRGAPLVAEVTDIGPGIPPDALAQIWAPFYTTKAEGTGIGLSIVRSLVEQQSGAAITVDSRLGVGTTFRLTMPTIDARPSAS